MIEPCSGAPPLRSSSLEELVGVYEANGGIIGELSYLWAKLTRGAHCELCDLTHAVVRPRRAFEALQARLPVPLRLVHLNEREPALMAFTEGRTPCVVGRQGSDWYMVLDAAQLRIFSGDLIRFEAGLYAVLNGVEGGDPVV